MEAKRDYDFTFGNEVEADCWDLDQDLLDEGCTANKVHQIQKIKQNMNDVVVSKRTTIKQVVDNEKESNTEHYKLNDCKQIKKRKETISTASSFKKTRKEEIRELLLCCANVRRKDSSISAVEENKKMHFIQTKNVKSCSNKITNDIFITIEQI